MSLARSVLNPSGFAAVNGGSGSVSTTTVTVNGVSLGPTQFLSGTVSASSTGWAFMGVSSVGAETLSGQRDMIMPSDCTMTGIYIRTKTDQPATGALRCAVAKNGVESVLSVLIAANSVGTQLFSNTSSTVTFLAGDVFAIHLTNLATSASANLQGFSCSVSN